MNHQKMKESIGKPTKGSQKFASPLNLAKKISKGRLPVGDFYTPGNLKSHYLHKQRDSGTTRDNSR